MSPRFPALIALAAATSLSACAPGNSHAVGFMKYDPDPGYSWANPNALFHEARWTPGQADADHPNIESAAEEREWQPLAGYQWGAQAGDPRGGTDYSERTLADDLTVHWQPGTTRPDYPHIRAQDHEGDWGADKGYVFRSKDDMAVQWTPGQPDPDREHYVSADTEGQWEPASGYAERKGWFGVTSAVWTSGLPYKGQPCMVSGGEEGRWRPIDGYHLEQQAEGRLKIVGDQTQTDWGRVVVGVAVGLIGISTSQPHEDDGAFAETIGRPIAGKMGEAGLEMAANSIGSTNAGSCAGVDLDSSWKVNV